MNIVYISDENYIRILEVSVASVIAKNSKEDLHFYIILNEENKLFEQFISRYKNRPNIVFTEIYKSLPGNFKMLGNLNSSTYIRLYLTELLPTSVEKIIYLDCDTLIVDSLYEMWNTDISDYLIAGVLDTVGKNAKELIGLRKDDTYINAGVLLINLKKWREENILDKFINFLENNDYQVEFNDQGVINYVMNSEIRIINPRYNLMPTYQRYDYDELISIVDNGKFYELKELEFAKLHPAIIHYAGYAFNRPWYIESAGKYIEQYHKFANTQGIMIELKRQPRNIKYYARKLAFKCDDSTSIHINKFIDKIYRIYREHIKRP